jgi:16S rRNA (adenine(1408)-N(1))-methyltransferase
MAREEPDRLVIGLDADAASMRTSARRAARRKDGQSNAAFVVAAIESVPADLCGVADRVTVYFPWGSLLRGLLAGDGVVSNLGALCANGAELTALWSVTDRDLASLGPVPRLPDEGSFEAVGLEVCELRPATKAEVGATHSTWAKRLRAGVDRPVSLLRAVRHSPAPRSSQPVQPDAPSCR